MLSFLTPFKYINVIRSSDCWIVNIYVLCCNVSISQISLYLCTDESFSKNGWTCFPVAFIKGWSDTVFLFTCFCFLSLKTEFIILIILNIWTSQSTLLSVITRDYSSVVKSTDALVFVICPVVSQHRAALDDPLIN